MTEPGPGNCMALLTVSNESVLAEAGNSVSVLTSSLFQSEKQGILACAMSTCALHVAGHSLLPLLVLKFGTCTVSSEW